MNKDEVCNSVYDDYNSVDELIGIKEKKFSTLHNISVNAVTNYKRLSGINGYYPPKPMSPYCELDEYMDMFNYLKHFENNLDILSKILSVNQRKHKINNGKVGNIIEQSLTNETGNKDSDRDTFVAEIKSMSLQDFNQFQNNLIIGTISQMDLTITQFMNTHLFKSKIVSILLITRIGDELDEMYSMDSNFWNTFTVGFQQEWAQIKKDLNPLKSSTSTGINSSYSFKGDFFVVRTSSQGSSFYPKLHISKDIFKTSAFKNVKKASDRPEIVYTENKLYTYAVPKAVETIDLIGDRPETSILF